MVRRMNLTFPNLGDTGRVLVQYIMESLGVPYIPPPPVSARTLERGLGLSRDHFCHPLKVLLGDMALAVERGATGLIMTESDDYCRYGFYWVVMKEILEDHFRRPLEFFILSHSRPLESFAAIVTQIGAAITEEAAAKILNIATARNYLYNESLRLRNGLWPVEKVKGSAFGAFRGALDIICSIRSFEDAVMARKRVRRLFAGIDVRRDTRPLKVLLSGEIYEVLEPSANFYLESSLSGLGVEVMRNLTSNDLVLFNYCYDDETKAEYERLSNHYRLVCEGARPWLGEEMSRGDIAFGGYGLYSVGSLWAAKKYECDGVIHLQPMGCMADTAARAIMRVISKDLEIPFISLSVDDHHADTGFLMRLEAFVDLLKSRRERKI